MWNSLFLYEFRGALKLDSDVDEARQHRQIRGRISFQEDLVLMGVEVVSIGGRTRDRFLGHLKTWFDGMEVVSIYHD
ncbi:hypothetical protein OIU85_009284 [Salix viminalis]|uniref:Uncharacterized protein n=1 Tax=Salix viminalis TaxID=40686 RepID=A0A9Q0NZH9_SALVM|nr:hypothetical protein OIU85_009284 [Salix viminalis]